MRFLLLLFLLSAGTLKNGVPVVTLLSLIKEDLPAEAKKYLHYGATSQDVMDTAQILMIREAIGLIEKDIDTLIQNLSLLSDQYGNAPCMAHTRGQQAIPITFGIKINAWMQPLQRQLQRLDEIKKSEHYEYVQLYCYLLSFFCFIQH